MDEMDHFNITSRTGRNARFREFLNDDWVTIVLHPGESRTHATFSRHDEGWSSSVTEWEFDGEYVRRRYMNDGVDCDGRMMRVYESECHLFRLRSRINTQGDEIIWCPEWERLGASQRDYSAEAAGY